MSAADGGLCATRANDRPGVGLDRRGRSDGGWDRVFPGRSPAASEDRLGSGVIPGTLARLSAIRPCGRSQGRAGRTRSCPGSQEPGLPDFGARSALAQCGQRSEPSRAVDQPVGLLRFRSYWTRVAPHAQENTATPSGTAAWLTKNSAVVEGCSRCCGPLSTSQRPGVRRTPASKIDLNGL